MLRVFSPAFDTESELKRFRPMKDTDTALQLINIHKAYGRQEVLKGISLTARKGEVLR